MQLWKRLELRPFKPKHTGDLTSKARAGYQTSHIYITSRSHGRQYNYENANINKINMNQI